MYLGKYHDFYTGSLSRIIIFLCISNGSADGDDAVSHGLEFGALGFCQGTFS